MSNDVLIRFPLPPEKSLVTITDADLGRLAEGRYLNDSLIKYWILTQFTHLVDEEEVIFFGPLFYTRLASSDQSHARYQNVRRWYKNKNVFEKKV